MIIIEVDKSESVMAIMFYNRAQNANYNNPRRYIQYILSELSSNFMMSFRERANLLTLFYQKLKTNQEIKIQKNKTQV